MRSGSLILCLIAMLCGGASGQRLRIPMPAPRPMGFRDPDGTPRGFVVDSLAEAAARSGLTIEWTTTHDAANNDEALRRGEIDLVAGAPSADRRREFFVSSPWWSSELVVLTPAASPIRNESELAGKRVAMPIGAGQDVRQHYTASTIVLASSAVTTANAVCTGTADAAVIAAMYVEELMLAASAPCRGVGLRMIDSKFTVDYVLIARPEAAKAARALKHGLDQITAEGTLAAIAARYPPVSTPHATRLAELLRLSYEQRLIAIGGVAGALLLLLAGAFVAKQIAARRRLRGVNQQLRHDLEARTRAEAALRESEERFRALFESAPLAVVAYDRSGVIVVANPEATRMFGRANLVGAPFATLLAESARGKLAQIGEGEVAGLTGLRAGGAEFPIELRLGAVNSPGGLTLAFIADSSERVALQQQLLQSQKLESVGQLAGGVAHDFNNLLTVITGYAHIALEDLADGDPRRDALSEIADAASRAAALTGQLLAFSRRQRATPRAFSLNDLLANVQKMLRRLIGEHIQLEVIPGEIGLVCADPGQIEQVVMNLAVNARDAMPDGGKLTISTAPLPDNPQFVAMTVADTGSGMTPEVKARIFEPFFTTKEQGKGTGLGLSTVYGIVKQAGGEVLVESELASGSTFRVVLPVASPAAEVTADAAPARQSRGTETILVAEDEPAVRRFVSTVLNSNGYRVLEAANGREALTVAAAFAGRIDLLLSDVVMPEMGGFDLADRLRECRPGAAVLHMCGYSDRVLEDGHALLRKPFSPDTLLARVREALGEARA